MCMDNKIINKQHIIINIEDIFNNNILYLLEKQLILISKRKDKGE